MLRSRRPFQVTAMMVFAGWFALMTVLGTSGYFVTAHGAFGFSAVQLAIVIPQLLFAVVCWLVPAIRLFIQTSDLTFLVAIQVARILALSHLVSWGYGLMAGGFALPVALGNLAVFMLALWAVSAVATRATGWQFRVYVLTFVGLAEFLMTIALSIIGFFTLPLPFDPGVASGGYVSFKLPPLSLFPTFAIPALTMVHVATLLALQHQRRSAGSALPASGV